MPSSSNFFVLLCGLYYSLFQQHNPILRQRTTQAWQLVSVSFSSNFMQVILRKPAGAWLFTQPTVLFVYLAHSRLYFQWNIWLERPNNVTEVFQT